jgi:hypothetical protein
MIGRYLAVDWGGYRFRVRKWRFRHNRRPKNVYMQVGPVEVTVWYR